MSSFFSQVHHLVRLIPAGKVASYGQLAALLGEPRAARTVGWALHALTGDSDVPWQRVIDMHGCITNTSHDGAAQTQRILLEREGIRFGADGRVDMTVYRWEGPTLAQLDDILRGGDGL